GNLGENTTVLSVTVNVPDIEQPKFQFPSVNDTTPLPNRAVRHNVNWTDDVALNFAILEVNSTGASCDTTANVTNTTLSGSSQWANLSWQVPSACDGKTIGWRQWANDSAGQWNVTDLQIYTVSPYGTLNVNLTSPTDPVSVNVNNNFTINATVSCTGDSGSACGTVYAYARYNASSANADTTINITEGATPFYVAGGGTGGGTYDYWGITNPSTTLNATGENTACAGEWCTGGTEITTAEYQAINMSDDTYDTCPTNVGGQRWCEYNFKINESETDIQSLTLWVETYNNDDPGSDPSLDYWNDSSNSWESWMIITKITDDDIADFLEFNESYAIQNLITADGYVHIRAQIESAAAAALIDYIKVDITSSGAGNPQTSSETLEQGESWNVSFTVNATQIGIYEVDVFFNSSYGNSNVPNNNTADSTVDVTSAAGDDPPKWQENTTNSTLAGELINHSVFWTDDTALSGFIFSFDIGTGSFT
ncbi:hypothetical protein LCGC14_2553140, partial [marine sediment metagenome]